jgi:hypothetical protein
MRGVAGAALVAAWTLACVACGSSPTATPASSHATTVKVVEQETAGAVDPTLEVQGDLAADVAASDLAWPSDAKPAVKAVFAGSWAPREPLGFDQTWFDEAALMELPANRLAGRRKWHGITSSGQRMLVDAQIRDRDGPAMAYTWWLLTWDEIVGPPEADLPAVIHFRHRGRVRLWFDGQLLIDEGPTEDGDWQTLRRAVTLTGSDDVFLVKSARGSPELGSSADFELCVSTPEGDAFAGQIWQTVRVW